MVGTGNDIPHHRGLSSARSKDNTYKTEVEICFSFLWMLSNDLLFIGLFNDSLTLYDGCEGEFDVTGSGRLILRYYPRICLEELTKISDPQA